ncbi:MAG TPA: GNAT family N-acetyltransferase [Nitrospiraceae bacterium]|nr:GNAT family N-acetyltransferase [Nitrospiraceae bacterium]
MLIIYTTQNHVFALAIAPTLTRQGLGRLLLLHIESLVFTRANNLCACVSDFNAGARRFYHRHGFLEVGPLPDLLVHGSAEILLRKTIGPVKDGNVPSLS